MLENLWNLYITKIIVFFTSYLNIWESPEHIFIFIINLLLFVNAKKLVSFFEHHKEVISKKTKIFRLFNITFLVFHFIDIAILLLYPTYENILLKFALSGVLIYISYFLHIFFANINKKIYGEKVNIDGKTINQETYSSKLTNILLDIVLIMLVIIILIKYWGYDGLLETTGVFGIILGFMALTAPVWAPDILNGLILLNNQLYSEGDIIHYNKEYYIVYKFGYTRATLLNIEKNIRTSVKNTMLSEDKIDNLTKLASTKGMREKLSFNIGYAVDLSLPMEKRKVAYQKHKTEVKNMFAAAYKASIEDDEIEISKKEDNFEIFVTSAGDYAVEWTIYFYVMNPKKTNTTFKARDYLNNRAYVNEKIVEYAYIHGIDLSTPDLQNVTLERV